MKLGKWLAKKPQQKASRSAPLLSFAQLGPARWTSRRYDKQAEEGYKRNVVAYRCIQLVAASAARIPWLLYNQAGQELAQHPLLELLHSPNPHNHGAALLEALYAHGQISGNAYLEAVRPDESDSPLELWALRPDRMKVLPGADGVVAAYEYSVNGRTVRWGMDAETGQFDILHLKRFHPTDDWLGHSPLDAAMMSIDQHNAASTWNQALLQNAARPTGALVYAPREGPALLSDDQYARLKAELTEQLEGAANAGRPLLLEGGLEWKTMALSPAEMDWKQGRDVAARDIALAFGVPPQLIGLSEGQTYSNYREARLAFYEETVLPLAGNMCEALNSWLVPMFDDGLKLALDLDEVPALAPRREAVWSRIAAADFLSADEKRAALGYGPL